MNYWLSVKDVAAHFKVSERTVRKWIAEGKLPSVLLGSARRIKAEDVLRFVCVNEVVS